MSHQSIQDAPIQDAQDENHENSHLDSRSDPECTATDPPAVMTQEDPASEILAEPIGDDSETDGRVTQKTSRRQRRRVTRDPAEARLRGRRQLCKRIADIAPYMLKTVKLRILGSYLKSTKGLSDDDLTERLKNEGKQIAAKDRILDAFHTVEENVHTRNLKWIILTGVLLQEETHSLEESRLEAKVIEYEKEIVKRAKSLDYFDKKKHDETRWHHYDTYRIVLEAAWRNRDDISADEANLLSVLRDQLNISMDEHWAIGAHLGRFPKAKCSLHTPEEIHEARKHLQKNSLLWSFRDDSDRRIDIVPYEVVQVLATYVARQELQRTNYHRLLQNDSIKLPDLRDVLRSREMDRYGNKDELIARIVESHIRPSDVLDSLDGPKLADMCRMVALKSSGSKADRISRLIDFYDDLTFEDRTTQDEREEWYNNYELLAARSYSDLKAKKIINKDLDIEHQFEKATDFLFESKLHVSIDHKKKGIKADGRILLDNRQSMLWDCKSVEKVVNLQDHLETQFDGYLRKEAASANQPLAFLVIGPAFSPHSLKLCHQYKARTNWDIALVTAEGLKRLAELWSSSSPGKRFPIRLLNRTDLIDKEKAEYLHSLA